ncbi:cysteine protease StiP family protein [Bacillus sp. WMMC1349]|uniref:cysteine protease StiP family protein n=1 Tax=Bacillus sp. WMMC1349 TaxID=2736254 RepID=UPI001554F9C8|nr:cysteine protease StiP family protein [Bacillus sp. WMMC1349]NPC91451.1 cysteine protease StiP family protein [Bacillus sp. WMMC1349]
MAGIVVKMGSYPESDVTFLLKDLSGFSIEKSTQERENLIQSGTHYSEMLPVEYKPTDEYMKLFYASLEESKQKVAEAVGIVAEQIVQKRGFHTVLCSLARAGTPIGVLIKRYIEFKYNKTLPHYSISIIRDRGIDENAIRYIIQQHPDHSVTFVDGWTGKGAITKELTCAVDRFNDTYGTKLSAELAVLADPGYCSDLFGTREDFLIPSACLNSTVSGLVSRTVLNEQWIGTDDFHGAKFYRDLLAEDVSNLYVDTITAEFNTIEKKATEIASEFLESKEEPDWRGLSSVSNIQKDFDIDNTHFIKPGVGETTRVLLRRVPWKILIQPGSEEKLKHILLLAEDRGVPVEKYTNMSYSCCGLIRSVGRDK